LRGVDDVQPASVGTTHNLIIVGLIDRLSYADAAPTGFLVGPMVNGIPANQFAVELQQVIAGQDPLNVHQVIPDVERLTIDGNALILPRSVHRYNLIVLVVPH